MKVKYIIISCLFLINVSCDSFLDINPKGEVIEEEMFNSPQGVEDALYGCYSALSTESLYGKELGWFLLDVQAQLFQSNYHNKGVDRASKYEYDNDEFKNTAKSKWTDLYKVVGYVNNIITNLERLNSSDFKLYDMYKGEALALRGFLHFEIVKLFAEHIQRDPEARAIPYVKKFSYAVTPFSTVKVVYHNIIKDLLEAEKLLTKDEEFVTFPRTNTATNAFATNRQIHLNLYAVKAMLARVYWYKGEMTDALAYAEDIIKSERFELVNKTEISDFVAGVISEKETIWGVYSSKLVDITKMYLYETDATSAVTPYNKQDDPYFPEPYEDLYNYDMDGEGTGTGTDQRKNHFRKVEDTDDSKIRCLKIVDLAMIENDELPSSRDLLAGINLIRLPEMYYIAAEALLEANPEKAREYFDEVLKSRGILPFALRTPAKTLSIESINYERRKEFFCEGQEWYNMKRQFRTIISNAQKTNIEASSEIYNWPIPIEEFDYRN